MDPVVMAAEQQIDGRPATGRRHDDDHRRPAWATAGTISPPQGRTPVDQVLGMSLPSAAGWSAHPAGAATREQRRHTTSSHRPGRQARGVTPRREGPTTQSPGHGTRFPGQLAEPVRPTQATLCCCWSAHGPAGPAASVGAEIHVILCSLGIFVHQAAEPVTPQDADIRIFYGGSIATPSGGAWFSVRCGRRVL